MTDHNDRNSEILWRRWGNLIKRLNSIISAVRNPCYTVATITVLIGPDGVPKLWTEPRTTKIEPRGADVAYLLAELAGQQQILLTDQEN